MAERGIIAGWLVPGLIIGGAIEYNSNEQAAHRVETVIECLDGDTSIRSQEFSEDQTTCLAEGGSNGLGRLVGNDTIRVDGSQNYNSTEAFLRENRAETTFEAGRIAAWTVGGWISYPVALVQAVKD